jgi:hypothetical protein
VEMMDQTDAQGHIGQISSRHAQTLCVNIAASPITLEKPISPGSTAGPPRPPTPAYLPACRPSTAPSAHPPATLARHAQARPALASPGGSIADSAREREWIKPLASAILSSRTISSPSLSRRSSDPALGATGRRKKALQLAAEEMYANAQTRL